MQQPDQYRHPREIEDAAQYRGYLFGTPRLELSGQRLGTADVPRRKAWDILVWFLLNPGKPCSAEVLADQLWADDDPNTALGSFHVSMHALKRTLEPELGRRRESTFIRRHANKIYCFETGGQWWTDVADVEHLHLMGHESELAGEFARARFYYRRLAGYVAQGPLLDGEPQAWLKPYRHKYAQMCQQSLTRLMRLEAEHGAEDELIESAYLTLKVDRHNQLATKIIVESSLRRGYRGAAQQRLASFCNAVRLDLGMPIPGEFLELGQRVGVRPDVLQGVTPLARDVTRREVEVPSLLDQRAS